METASTVAVVNSLLGRSSYASRPWISFVRRSAGFRTITNWAYGLTVGLTLISGTTMLIASRADDRERAAVAQRERGPKAGWMKEHDGVRAHFLRRHGDRAGRGDRSARRRSTGLCGAGVLADRCGVNFFGQGEHHRNANLGRARKGPSSALDSSAIFMRAKSGRLQPLAWLRISFTRAAESFVAAGPAGGCRPGAAAKVAARCWIVRRPLNFRRDFPIVPV